MAEIINILKKNQKEILILLPVAIITGTLLRVSLILAYPLFIIFLAAFFRLKVTASLLILLLFVGISCVLSFYPQLFLRYKLLSLFYMLPLLLFLFSKPPAKRFPQTNYTEIFLYCLAAVMLINDIIGVIQVIRRPGSDDSFTGIYGQFSVSLNGLMLTNTVVFFYFFMKYLYHRNISVLLLSLFFLTSAVLGYYGAGLAVSLGAFILTFFRAKISSVLKTLVAGGISLVIIYYLMFFIKPGTLQYNIENIRNLMGIHVLQPPRKIQSFYNYFDAYTGNAKDLLFGSGPGTFNSRSAFIIGSPSYFTASRIIKDTAQPYYFKNYAYTLWNDSNTSQALYLDGFRNQPFSSLLAFLGEYGLIFTVAFFVLYYFLYRDTARQYYRFSPFEKGRHDGAHKAIPRGGFSSDASKDVLFRLFKFLIILLPLLLVIDNYFEYPEIMLLILLGIKLAQIDLSTRNL